MRSAFFASMALVFLPAALITAAVPGQGSRAIRECSTIILESPIDPPLRDSERILVCEELKGGINSPAWSRIPHSQRSYHLNVFLQDRGYHHPSFELQDGTTRVTPGEKTAVSEVVLKDPPPGLDFEKRRGIVAETLTPQLLDEVRNWMVNELRVLGYACPAVTLAANPDSGLIEIVIRSGMRTRVTEISEDPVPGLLPGVFRRYDAFVLGEPYNEDLVKLTESRALSDGHVESLRLRVAGCSGDTVRLHQEVIAGPPRLLAFGFGVNTEGLFLVRGSWRITRLGRTASLLDTSALASLKRQRIGLAAHWFFRPVPSRLFFRPEITFEHQNETPFEAITFKANFAPSTSLDTRRFGFSARIGPSYNFVSTIRGIGPPRSHLVSLDAAVHAASHYFDYYLGNPRAGFSSDLTFSLNSRNFASDFDAQQLRFAFQGLWNYREYDPPLWVFGVRGIVSSTFTSEPNPTGGGLPPSFLYFLGGAENLRGFGRGELPEPLTGGLSAAYLGAEARLASGLPWGMQPFTFLDAGALGTSSTRLAAPIYWSPGLGLRIASPIGTFRTTLAHGFAAGPHRPEVSHLQFYFSYGEEF
ncbi:MAG: hypothetical protein A2428_03950 [Bdellovibrionales bacterium RIFOXYC1_FULL_54_43]|nr:MAG: hypothetical protein A2428_03950 [Bdellovibrionales bacterium RIFOXYC1_FULL_54_43]OFZ85682.1 MAG: hypothetical protein A2603_16825 [Bdellovibrionales bacterium RIFOXYD1_FULL_55_31]